MLLRKQDENSKRAFQFEEFKAHPGSRVNCLHIGRKSGRVLVTGGDDQLVKMWAIGKEKEIMALDGHSSAIGCVSFDIHEENVLAGSAGGTLKLWDLDQQKVVRTMNGHKTNCTSVDFHPFGEFFASGSLDTNLKIWDIRRKGCIQTYRGHTNSINVICFSPDGRWVMSGGEDGVVKLWDLTAGKLLHDFRSHSGPITSLVFHPQELLLATGSSDRTVKFWDLENFQMISSTDVELTAPKSFMFNENGFALLCAYGDSLKVWGYEPIQCYDTVHVSWKEVKDMNIIAGQLISCAVKDDSVIGWAISLQKLRPFVKDQVIFDPPSNVRSSLDMKKTSEALKQLEESQSKANNYIQSGALSPCPESKKTKVIENRANWSNSGHSRSETERSEVCSAENTVSLLSSGNSSTSIAIGTNLPSNKKTIMPILLDRPEDKRQSNRSSLSNATCDHPSDAFPSGEPANIRSDEIPYGKSDMPTISMGTGSGSADRRTAISNAPNDVSIPKEESNGRNADLVPSRIASAPKERPIGLDPNVFLPKSSAPPDDLLTTAEILEELNKSHNILCSILVSRTTNLKVSVLGILYSDKNLSCKVSGIGKRKFMLGDSEYMGQRRLQRGSGCSCTSE